MTDVRQQLIEALAEAEKLARDAIQAATCGCHVGADTSRWLWEGGDSVQVDNGTGHSVITGASWGTTFLDDRTGEWIAKWSPSTVLRLIGAHRKLIIRYDVARDEDGELDEAIVGSLEEAELVITRRVILRVREQQLREAAAFWLGTPEGS